jgi:hypothetical protein
MSKQKSFEILENMFRNSINSYTKSNTDRRKTKETLNLEISRLLRSPSKFRYLLYHWFPRSRLSISYMEMESHKCSRVQHLCSASVSVRSIISLLILPSFHMVSIHLNYPDQTPDQSAYFRHTCWIAVIFILCIGIDRAVWLIFVNLNSKGELRLRVDDCQSYADRDGYVTIRYKIALVCCTYMIPPPAYVCTLKHLCMLHSSFLSYVDHSKSQLCVLCPESSRIHTRLLFLRFSFCNGAGKPVARPPRWKHSKGIWVQMDQVR